MPMTKLDPNSLLDEIIPARIRAAIDHNPDYCRLFLRTLERSAGVTYNVPISEMDHEDMRATIYQVFQTLHRRELH